MKLLISSILTFLVLTFSSTSSVLGDDYDITTVYKFHAQEEYNENGDTTNRYFNTCTVTVHPQTNAVGLPYVRIDQFPEIVYPLKTPSIPSLWNTGNEWKTLNSDGITEAKLVTMEINRDNFFRITDKDIFYDFEKNQIKRLIEKWSESYGTEIYGKSETSSYLNNYQNTFLHVQVPIQYSNVNNLGIELLDRSGQIIMLQVESSTSTIQVCPSWSKCENHVYQTNTVYQISLFFTLKGHLKIYDGNAKKVIFADKRNPNHEIIDWVTVGIRQPNCQRDRRFDIVQLNSVNVLNFLSGDKTHFSPWFQNKNNYSSLFILYARKSGKSVSTQLKEFGTANVMQLTFEEQFVINSTHSGYDEIVLAKTHVRFPENWTQMKRIAIKADPETYIRDIWEGGDQDLYKIDDNQTCVKSDITEIYDVALKTPKRNGNVSILCFNGGKKDMITGACACPPGFTGESCEIACDRNSYGQQCSNQCSRTGTDCQGMILCTPSYGCSCAPGYHGDKCTEQCEQGTYGADCTQSCGQCKDGCDIYTGQCRGQCDTPYLIWPTCKESHSYWTEQPQTLDSTFTSVKLGLNLSISNIKKFSDDTQFYMIQYKEESEITWKNRSYETFSPIYTEYEVDNLKAGIKYFIRVLLVDKSLKTNDPKLSIISEVSTKCKVSEIKNNLNVTKVTNTSIVIIWNKESVKLDDKECPFTSYILEIEMPRDDFIETRKIVNIQRNSLVIRSLLPATTYTISLKKSIVHGESSIVSQVQATTDQSKDSLMDVAGLRTTVMGSEVHLQWFKHAFIRTYYIKYRLLKILACSHEELLQSPLQNVPTKYTNYTLKLTPNALYELFVTGDDTLSTNANKQTVVTKGRLPDIAPILLKQEFRVTNESAAIYWKDAPDNCQKLNGFFKKYLLELMDIQNTIINTYETVDRKMEITGLDPKTEYNLRVKYVNHIGSNNQMYDAASFHTRATSFLIAQDLTAYKTSANTIGIRWRMPDYNSTITRIEIKVQNHSYNNSINITNMSSVQCKAWPSYSCYDITKLKQNTKYTVSVEIFSDEFPDGGSHKSVQVVTRETAPNAVTDIKVVNISNTNVTVSWRIPFILNGILRKFLIEVEHLSSLDESQCCQPVLTINHAVTEEKEIYSHVIDNIQNASSYQVTIRAFTKRLGQESSKIIDIPPPLLPIKQKPIINVDSEDIVWEDQATTNTTTVTNDIAADILVIVQSEESSYNINEPSIRSELGHYLKPNDWWIAHVCPGNDKCSFQIGTGEQSESAYGEINNKPLIGGHNYTIVLAQVNKYLSARSYTIVKSVPFHVKGSSTPSTTTAEPVGDMSPGEEIQEVRNENEDNNEGNPSNQPEVVPDTDVVDYEDEVLIED